MAGGANPDVLDSDSSGLDTLGPALSMRKADGRTTPLSGEAVRVLSIAQDLSTTLASSQVQKVVWAEKNGRRILALPDSPAIRGRVLFISREVEGKLEAQDWRALLTSSIIYDSKLRIRRRLARAAIVSGIVLVSVASYFAVATILSYFSPTENSYSAGKLGGPIFALFIGGAWLTGALVSPYMRHLRFVADQMTVQEYGSAEPLLTALQKVEAMGLGNGTIQKGRLAQMPSVKDRIQKLSTGNIT